MADEQVLREADRMYWETGTPVAEIAERLDISRRALYDAIVPRPIGLACAECGGELVFRNRSASERHQAECVACEAEVLVEPLPPEEAGAADAGEPQVEQERAAGPSAPVDRRPVPEPGHGAGLGASLVAGLALGALAAYLFRQK